MIRILTFLFLALFFFDLQGQCDIVPEIEGENVLCPNGSSVLMTQEFESYQWYSRAWGEDTAKPIENATNQQLNIDESQVLNYISVEVSYDTCTIISEEVLIDQWLFLLPVIQHTGDYAYIDNGLTYLCPEHEFSFELLLPYTTNISWYLNGELLPGETQSSLKVTKSGYYTVSGAPEICPDYIVPLGLEVGVEILETTMPELSYNEESFLLEVLNQDQFVQFEWYFNGEILASEAKGDITVENSGEYSVKTTDENGCISQANLEVLISSVQGISNSKTILYPNPSGSNLNIQSDILFNEYSIYTLLGKLVQSGKYSTTIRLGELYSGDYIIILKNDMYEERILFSKKD